MITTAGVYSATFTVISNQPSVIGLNVPSSTYTSGSGAGTQVNTGQVIFSADAGQVVSLFNYSAYPIDLPIVAGNNASLVIVKPQ